MTGLLGLARQAELSMFKSDVDSAFRRVPVAPDHREFGYIAFKYKGRVIVAEHASTPFGSIASVHHWERIGGSILP